MPGWCWKLPGSSLGFQVTVCSLTWLKRAATGLMSREGSASAGQEGLAAAPSLAGCPVPLGSFLAFPSSGVNAITGNKEIKSRTDSGSQQLMFITLAVPQTWHCPFS